MYLLEGLKVLDAASYLAAPGAATIMADYGADVIKVEAPAGDGYRLLHGRHHHDYNWHLTSRNKRDIAIDISSEAGQGVLHRLIDEADVLILNFREDQLKKFNLDYEQLSKRNPRLIYAQLTGFGTAGPDRKRRGYDTTAWWARSGILDLMKPFGGAPVYPVGGVGDHASAMTLFAAIMMALYDREKTGQGREVSTSLIANGCWSAGMHLQGMISGYNLGAILDEKGYRSPFASVFETRDGQFIAMVLPNPDREWKQIVKCIGKPEWLEAYPDTASVMQNKDAVRDLVKGVFASHTALEISAMLDTEQLTYSVVEKISDVVKDAHLIENRVIVPTASDNEDFQWTVSNPITVGGAEKRPPNDPPALGEHTRDVLKENGFDDAEIEALLGNGVVVQSTE